MRSTTNVNRGKHPVYAGVYVLYNRTSKIEIYKVKGQYFEVATEAAKYYDLLRIKKGKQPKNILKAKTNV